MWRQVPPAEVRVVELPGLSLHGGLFEFGLLAAVHAVSERCASTGRYRWRLASAKDGEENRVGPGHGGTDG
jgi:hypothetical protein